MVYHEHPDIGKAILRMFTEQLPGLRVMASHRLNDLPHLLLEHSPVIVWMDVHAPSEQVQWFNRFRTFCPGLRFLGFSAENPVALHLKLGWSEDDVLYSGPIPWHQLAEHLYAQGMMGRLDDGESLVPVRLTRRQLQLLALLRSGMSNHEMALALNISEHTVKVHFWRLFKRMGVSNRLQALHKAVQSGLLTDQQSRSF